MQDQLFFIYEFVVKNSLQNFALKSKKCFKTFQYISDILLLYTLNSNY